MLEACVADRGAARLLQPGEPSACNVSLLYGEGRGSSSSSSSFLVEGIELMVVTVVCM